jgi:rhodanese-related sulfurtransferase
MSFRYLLFAIPVITILAGGCSPSGTKENKGKTAVVPQPVEVNQEARLLLKVLEESGDYVNSRNFPSMIKASVVFAELGTNNHVIDLRTPEQYKNGHIKGAVNVSFEGLPEYLETKIKPFEFGKIILVCSTGQVSGYTASLLRLMGYGNVYAMRWGMAAWNKKLAAETWLKDISSDYENRLDTTTVAPAAPADLPVLQTGKSTGDEIRDFQFRKLMAEGSQIALITAKEVFTHPENYYIINFERKDKYDSGHIPGAVRYKQNGTLGILSEMETIPSGKTVVLYCGTGHNSAFATAYLRLFGYNAKTLMYGNNAFMHDKMVKEKATLSWLPFTEEDIHNYELVRQ